VVSADRVWWSTALYPGVLKTRCRSPHSPPSPHVCSVLAYQCFATVHGSRCINQRVETSKHRNSSIESACQSHRTQPYNLYPFRSMMCGKDQPHGRRWGVSLLTGPSRPCPLPTSSPPSHSLLWYSCTVVRRCFFSFISAGKATSAEREGDVCRDGNCTMPGAQPTIDAPLSRCMTPHH